MEPRKLTGTGPILAVTVFSIIAFFIAAGSLLSFLGYTAVRVEELALLSSDLGQPKDMVVVRRRPAVETAQAKRDASNQPSAVRDTLVPVRRGASSTVVRFLLFFSLASTWPEFCCMPHHPQDLRMLDGLKVISIIWIIFGHVLLWQIDDVDNEALTRMMFSEQSQWYWKFLYRGHPAVDTFLFAGGFLAVHFLIKHGQRKDATAAPAQPSAKDSIELSFVPGKTTSPPVANAAGLYTIDMDAVVPPAKATESSTDMDEGDTSTCSRDDAPLSPWYTVRTSLYVFLHRWLRLTPAYALVILFYVNLYSYGSYGYHWDKSDSPLHMNGVRRQNCVENWWTNILYINNLYPEQFNLDSSEITARHQCLIWSWYLAVDFQLFLVAVPVGLLFTHHRRACYIFVVLATLAVVAVRTALITAYDLGACSGFDANEFHVSYIKPYTRGIPYFAGMLLAMLRHDKVAVMRQAGALMRAAAHAVAFALLLSAVLMDQEERYNSGLQIYACRWGAGAGNAVHVLRPIVWTAGLFILGWGMVQRWRTWTSAVLSWSGWVFLSRLVYGAYIIHPLIIAHVYDTVDQVYSTSGEFVLVNMLGITVVTFFVAFVMYIGVEMPLMNATKTLLAGRLG